MLRLGSEFYFQTDSYLNIADICQHKLRILVKVKTISITV